MENRKSLGIGKMAAMAALAAIGGSMRGTLALPDMSPPRSYGTTRRLFKPNRNRCTNQHPGVRNPKIAAQVNQMHAKWCEQKGISHAE